MENTETNVPDEQHKELNYEQEYAKMKAENEKLKASISKTNSENAKYKKEAMEKMTAEEQRNIEFETLKKEIAAYKLKDSLLGSGYTADEIAILVADECSPASYAKVMAARMKAQAESLKAQEVANSTAKEAKSANGSNEGDSLATRLAKEQFGNSSAEIKKMYN